MREKQIIERTPEPRTRKSLAADFSDLGLEEGMTVLMHSSLSALGWVCGGSVTVIQAVLDVIGRKGTLVMPAHSGDNSDPKYWNNPPVPREWFDKVIQSMPAFDPRITPTRGIGEVSELSRRWPASVRSSHPTYSFSALGKHKKKITVDHQLDFGLGEHSPLATLYELDAKVLLLGVGYESNTCFHLAEYRQKNTHIITQGSKIFDDEGHEIWKEYQDIDKNTSSFPQIGSDFERQVNLALKLVGSAKARFFNLREAVDFAESWLNHYNIMN